MRILRNLTIRRKLLAITLIIGSVALAVACAAFATYDYISFRQTMVKELCASADLIAANSTAALSFNDHKAASEALSSLAVVPDVLSAEIRDGEDKELAEYVRPGGYEPAAQDTLGANGWVFGRNYLVVCRAIWLNGKQIGTIRISSDLGRLYGRMGNYAIALVVVLVAGLAASMLVISRLQRVICDPVLDLTRTARKIARDKSYTLRAHKFGEDELGELTDCFNEMLREIASRDVQLAAHRDHLEEEVRLRTEELRTARDRAEAASRAKSAFLANMSHEIRTPVTAIVGYSDMLMESRQNLSDRLDYLQVIQRNARHLVSLINDILDISKIEADRMTVERISCDLPQLIFEVVSMMRPRAIEKALSFRCEADGPLPRTIRSDPLRLKQVLVNIIGNAIKFTQQGEVLMRVSCQGAGEESILTFNVRDDGIGMDAQKLGRLFQPFTQADESMTRRYGGTGLGLAISKRLAMLLGGDVTASSTIGIGSVFTVTVQAGSLEGAQMVRDLDEAIARQEQEQPPSEAELKLEAKILLAEDGPDNQRLISAYLRQSGAEVVVVENGREAVEAMAAGAYDLVLMDMQMPEMDGYTATRLLRKDGCKLPIVALTAHAMAEDRGKCLDAGCTEYLTKPVDRQRMLRVLAEHVPHRHVAAGAAPAAGAARLRSRHADDPNMRDLVSEFVGALPARVSVMGQLLAREDLLELQRRLHQLKGAGSGYGFPDITAEAAAAEMSIKQHEELEQIGRKVRSLIALVRSVEGYRVESEAAAVSPTAAA